MNQQYELIVKLTIKGPLITSGGGDATRGLNCVFSLNAEEQPVLRGSHVKGKLKEAMRELSAVLPDKNYDLHILFGTGQDEQNPDFRNSQRASIQVSDFILDENTALSSIGRNTRVTIDSRTGTSREQHLQMLEKRFESGSSITWTGTISFFSSDQGTAQALGKHLEIGLKWITSLGATKGTGYGRLEKVSTELTSYRSSAVASFDGDGLVFPLCFEFIDDLLIGGRKKPKSNFVESEKVIPGSVIKGSLARFLNMICGVKPATMPIDRSNCGVADDSAYPLFAKYFSRLRFLHAFPVLPGRTVRPVVLPYSAVQVEVSENEIPFGDVALLDGAVLDKKNRAPRFQIDWKESYATKNLFESFGWGTPEIINKTRTAIEEKTRTAKEEKLYTFQYLTPYQVLATDDPDEEKKRVRWISRILLPKMDQTEKQRLLQELNRAIHLGWRHMGKRDSRFRLVDIGKEACDSPFAPRKSTFSQAGLAVIMLQTDTLMFDAKALAEEKSGIDLHAIYENYWDKITGGSCKLLRFFARQRMSGGYLAKSLYPLYRDCYYPYVLTEAGSVFVLKILNEDVAVQNFLDFTQKGLPLPPQIIELFPEEDEQSEHWKHCPYVPENGYGEIIFNLDWHWEKCLSSPAAGDAS
jgi:hypothetical protein